MFQKGEYIMYGSTGVCRVEDVAVPDNIPMKEKGGEYLYSGGFQSVYEACAYQRTGK